MRLSPVLSVRQWLAKLHPPLPQTPRESQQLLEVLQGSFRKHLDEVHPAPAQKQSSTSSRHELNFTSPDSSSIATLHHFNTLLNNPLLAKQTEKLETKPPVSKDSVDSFVAASSTGNVTLPLLRRLMAAYLRGIASGETIAENDRFSSQLALWLHETDPAMKEAFLSSTEILDLGVKVAGIDKEEGRAWEWLRMIYERDFGSVGSKGIHLRDSKWLLVEDSLVSYLMRLSIRSASLEEVAHQFVQACQYRQMSGRAACRPEEASRNLQYIPLERSWKRLAAAITHFRTRHGISDSMFDQVLQYGMSWSHVPQFSTSVVRVYHPKSPSATELFQHLSDGSLASNFVSKQASASKKFRRAMLLMILDGAQLSLDQGRKDHAHKLLDFAHKHYTEFLPVTVSKSASGLDSQIQQAQGELLMQSQPFAWT